MWSERRREDARWAGGGVICGVFGVLLLCCLPPPSFPFGYLVRATLHPAGMSTSPGATDGSQRNSCKWPYCLLLALGVVVLVCLCMCVFQCVQCL